jgi:hypothetical protein
MSLGEIRNRTIEPGRTNSQQGHFFSRGMGKPPLKFWGDAFTRAPAQGTFEDKGTVHRDDILIFEVMTDRLDRVWWASYRAKLEAAFAQDEIVVRTSPIERL